MSATFPVEERIHPVRSADRLNVALHLGRYRWAAQHVRGLRVLDIACGTGYGSRILREEGGAAEVVGADRDAQALAAAREEFSAPGVRFVRIDDAASYAPEAPFDAVVSLETLEHLPDPIGFARLAHGWLRPGGRWIVSAPVDEPPGANPFHLHLFRPGWLDAAVGEGFRIGRTLDQEGHYRTVSALRRERTAPAWGLPAKAPAATAILPALGACARTAALVESLRWTPGPVAISFRDGGSADLTPWLARLYAAAQPPAGADPPLTVLLCPRHAAIRAEGWLEALAGALAADGAWAAAGEGSPLLAGRFPSPGADLPEPWLLCASGGILCVRTSLWREAGSVAALLARLAGRPVAAARGIACGAWGESAPDAAGALAAHPVRDPDLPRIGRLAAPE